MAEPDKTREPAINRENKASAMRWAIGLVAVLAIGVAAWLITNPGGEPIDPAPQRAPTAGPAWAGFPALIARLL
jgi:hypothetical protein